MHQKVLNRSEKLQACCCVVREAETISASERSDALWRFRLLVVLARLLAVLGRLWVRSRDAD